MATVSEHQRHLCMAWILVDDGHMRSHYARFPVTPRQRQLATGLCVKGSGALFNMGDLP